MRRRDCLFGLASAGIGASCGSGARTAADGCWALRGQTIRWVVPYPPGGTYDVMSRLLEASFEKELGAEIQIVNEAGGGGLSGARKLRDARPDGRTLGVINAPGLLAGALAGLPGCPNPLTDYTVLGRLSRSRSVWVTGARSPLRTVADLLERAKSKPLLFGVTGAGSNNMMSVTGGSSLLGVQPRFVAGYGGSREEMLAVMRGEVDLMSTNYETLQPAVEAGELRALLQMGVAPSPEFPSLAHVDLLGGESGWAARRAAVTGRTAAQAMEDAAALEGAIAAGVIVLGPRGIAPAMRTCLTEKLGVAVRDQEFQARVKSARRTLYLAIGGEAVQGLTTAAAGMERFVPALREAMAGIGKQ